MNNNFMFFINTGNPFVFCSSQIVIPLFVFLLTNYFGPYIPMIYIFFGITKY